MSKTTLPLTWQYRIPLFSWYITKGMLIGFSVPILIILLIAAKVTADGQTWESLTPDIYFAMGSIGLLFFTTYLVLWLLFRNGFATAYKIDAKGVYQYSGQRSKNVNRVVTVAGLLARSAATTGAGLIAYSQEDRFIPWSQLKFIKIDEANRYIHLSRARIALAPIGMFCLPNNFTRIKRIIRSNS